MQHYDTVCDNIRRILAPNPSPLTFQGTNTYLIGQGDVAIIDPGPAISKHKEAILSALRPGETITSIFVTHAHLDHSELAPDLAKETGAKTYAAGAATDGRSKTMQSLAQSGLAGEGEGLDLSFAPHEYLDDRQTIAGESWQIETIATPGHLGTHMAFAFETSIFSGDHVMGWSTTVVSPPDGDMGAYMGSLERLSHHSATMYLPGHGPEIHNPSQRLSELIAHRKAREAALLSALKSTPRTTQSLTREIYTDIGQHLLPAAERNVLAHLIDLTERGVIQADGPLGLQTGFCVN